MRHESALSLGISALPALGAKASARSGLAGGTGSYQSRGLALSLAVCPPTSDVLHRVPCTKSAPTVATTMMMI